MSNNTTATAELSDTKRKLLDASVKLMRSKGFNATTVDDICTAAGVTKGGFFHYFASKQDIAKAATTRFREIRRQTLDLAPFNQLTDPLERIFGRLNFIRDDLKTALPATGGCLIGMFAQELSSSNPELRQACQESFSWLAKALEKDFAEAKSQYAPHSTVDPKGLATLFVAVYQGSVLMAKTADGSTAIDDNFAQFTELLTNVFTPSISLSATPVIDPVQQLTW